MYTKVKILSLEISDPRYGTFFVTKDGGIGGKPFPSEAEAHKFRNSVIPDIEEAIKKIMNKNFFSTT
jgi:hypothetical protein